MNLFVLTRTSNRPIYFNRLRRDLLAQEFNGYVIHAVHSDTPEDDYIEGDIIVHGDRLRKSADETAPWEKYNLRLLEAVLKTGIQGYVTFIDDDDTYVSKDSIERMMQFADPKVMPVWKVQRENGRISPTVWQGDLSSRDGRICWEASTFSTELIPWILKHGIDGNDGGDGRFWARLAGKLEVIWQDEVLVMAQGGKGHGRRKDA